ncbi:unnamed protein product, partial [Rotaria sordida]
HRTIGHHRNVFNLIYISPSTSQHHIHHEHHNITFTMNIRTSHSPSSSIKCSDNGLIMLENSQYTIFLLLSSLDIIFKKEKNKEKEKTKYFIVV